MDLLECKTRTGIGYLQEENMAQFAISLKGEEIGLKTL